jgi:hypothetical protein
MDAHAAMWLAVLAMLGYLIFREWQFLSRRYSISRYRDTDHWVLLTVALCVVVAFLMVVSGSHFTLREAGAPVALIMIWPVLVLGKDVIRDCYYLIVRDLLHIPPRSRKARRKALPAPDGQEVLSHLAFSLRNLFAFTMGAVCFLYLAL